MKWSRRVVAVGLLLMMALGFAGCAGVKPSIPLEEEASQTRRERNAEVARDFDKRRDFAEYQAAHSRWVEGDHTGCLERLQTILARNPDHLDARLLLADVLMVENKPQEAIEALQPALDAHPRDARVQYSMGLLWDSLGRHGDAQACYERAVKLEPANEVYQVSFEEAVSGVSQQTPIPPAPTDSSPETRQNPPRVTARFLTSGSSAGRAEESEPVENDDRAVPSAPSNTEDLVQHACEAMSQGNPQLAVAYFQRAVAERPNEPQIPITAAISALRYNRPEVAVEILEPAAAQFPLSATVRRILGTAYYRRGDYHASQLALQQALSLDKSHALSYFLMGCTLVKLGNPEAAEQHFRQARLLDPKYRAVR